MLHGKFEEYYKSLTEPSVASHFDFFESVPGLSEAAATAIWWNGLKVLEKNSDPVFEPLKERYVTDKNNGQLRQYWNDRKLVQEEEKTNKAAAIQTSISINRATTRVLQSADKQVENRLNKADGSNLPDKYPSRLSSNAADAGSRVEHDQLALASPSASSPGATATNSAPTSDVLPDSGPDEPPSLAERGMEFNGFQGQPTMSDQDHESDIQAELAMVASCTPFAHLVMVLYEKYGQTPTRIDAPVPFPTHVTKDLYNFAKNILDNWSSCSKIEQKDCLVALSGIVNTLDPEMQVHCAAFSDVIDQCLDKDLFAVSEAQEAIYKDLKQKLGRGTMKELRTLRRYCSRRRDDLEEDYDNDGWSMGEEDTKGEQLKIMQMMSFLCDEIISMQRIPKSSEHEDVFVWRGLARILYEHDLIVRVGELGSSATREDRTLVENKFGGIDSNVRGRKIDIMHQLCLQGRAKPIEMVAWEAKSEAVAGEALQCQLRKNIRINASIMNKLSQYMERDFPRPSPMVLDIVGSRALVYTVRKIQPGIFGAGAVGEKLIELPTNTNEIAEFLDGGSMSALLRIGLHNSEFACLLKKGYRKALSQEIMAKMTGKANVRKEGPPVIFTPMKKQKQKHKQQHEDE